MIIVNKITKLIHFQQFFTRFHYLTPQQNDNTSSTILLFDSPRQNSGIYSISIKLFQKEGQDDVRVRRFIRHPDNHILRFRTAQLHFEMGQQTLGKQAPQDFQVQTCLHQSDEIRGPKTPLVWPGRDCFHGGAHDPANHVRLGIYHRPDHRRSAGDQWDDRRMDAI